MSANLFRCLKHIKAANPLLLEKEMLQIQQKLGAELAFHHVQYVQGNWYAWYYVDRTDEVKAQMSKGLSK